MMRLRTILAALFCCLCGSAWAQSYPSPQLYQAPLNLTLNVSVTSHVLTVAINDPNGNVPSASHPVLTNFRNATGGAITSGALAFVPITAATFFTTGATSDSIGCATGVVCRLWVWEINNSGSVAVCLYNTLSGTSIVDLDEGNVQSSASGTGGGTSTQTLYCSASSVSSSAVRRLGYIEAVWTSGTGWASPTKVVLFGPSIPRPGSVVQMVTNVESSQQSYGTSYTTIHGGTLSVTSAANLIKIREDFQFIGVVSANQLFRIARSSTLVGTPQVYYPNSGSLYQGGTLVAFDIGQSGSTTYNFQGETGSGTGESPYVQASAGVDFLEIDEIAT
jgi:hypothetical protein